MSFRCTLIRNFISITFFLQNSAALQESATSTAMTAAARTLNTMQTGGGYTMAHTFLLQQVVAVIRLDATATIRLTIVIKKEKGRLRFLAYPLLCIRRYFAHVNFVQATGIIRAHTHIQKELSSTHTQTFIIYTKVILLLSRSMGCQGSFNEQIIPIITTIVKWHQSRNHRNRKQKRIFSPCDQVTPYLRDPFE